MKNLQKFAVALLVGIMAIGFSAFKSVKKSSTNRAITYYALNSSGNFYRLLGNIDQSDDCTSGPSLPCVIEYPSEVDPDGFTPADRPSGGTNLGQSGYVPQ